MKGLNPLARELVAEFAGTFILVFFGLGAVHAAVLTGALVGLLQVALVWAFAVMTAAFAVFRGFPMKKVGPYIFAQVVGAFFAAMLLYVLFGGALTSFEVHNGIVRGLAGSESSAMIYGEYFPNPAMAHSLGWGLSAVSEAQAMLGEFAGTAFLSFFIFALTDRRGDGSLWNLMVPVLIGLCVALIIAVVAPITQAGLNPARDFGPRLFAFFAGWGSVAIPGPRGGFFTVYILSPILGSLLGAAIYQFILRPSLSSITSNEKVVVDE